MFIINIHELQDSFDKILQELPECRRERILKLKREEGRLQSAAAGYLLKRVFGIDEEKDIVRDSLGKPHLRHETGGVRFVSLSHGGDYAVIAGGDEPLGVDVEKIEPYHESVVKRCFRPDEREWVMERDTEERFYAVWTMKESIMKADGRGLALHPAEFSVFDTEWKAAYRVYDGHVFAEASGKEPETELVRLNYEPLP